MATQADVRRISLSLPAAEAVPGRFAFGVPHKGKLKSFVWVWMERVTATKPRVPNFDVIAVRVADLGERDRLLASRPKALFTEPHYEGFPAVLVRLDQVSADDLKTLLTNAWQCQAPKDLVRKPAIARPIESEYKDAMAEKKSKKRQLKVKKAPIRDLAAKKKGADVKAGLAPPYVPVGSKY